MPTKITPMENIKREPSKRYTGSTTMQTVRKNRIVRKQNNHSKIQRNQIDDFRREIIIPAAYVGGVGFTKDKNYLKTMELMILDCIDKGCNEEAEKIADRWRLLLFKNNSKSFL